MVTQEEAKKYYLNVYAIGSIYVWGFNSGTIISEESIKQAYKNCGSTRYNWDYYLGKLKEGKGKNGSDCSGMHFPLSKKDTTAQGYYNLCPKKGNFSTLPANKIVLLFKGSNKSNITHTGVYLGDGKCIHMKNSKENCVYEDVSKHGWTFWGMPDWIDYNSIDPDYGKYTYDTFIADVKSILHTTTLTQTFNATVTISTAVNKKHALVTPLEKYMKALGYYKGEIEADVGKIPVFGAGMKEAIRQYQKEIVLASERNCDGVLTQKQATWKKLIFN